MKEEYGMEWGRRALVRQRQMRALDVRRRHKSGRAEGRRYRI
jgi:hypothetical protein